VKDIIARDMFYFIVYKYEMDLINITARRIVKAQVFTFFPVFDKVFALHLFAGNTPKITSFARQFG
jgi:hypothetical protein